MKRLTPILLAVVLVAFAIQQSYASPGDRQKSSAFNVKLPIPDYEISCDLSLWRGNFQIVKMSYNQDDAHVVFVLKALRDFKFTDDGFENIQFLDEDGVDMVDKKNLKFSPPVKDLKKGELTHAELDIPDDDTLKKTKSARAVAKGFFQK